MFHFVQVKHGDTPQRNAENRSAIRSHAMKHFRSRQRRANHSNGHGNPTVPESNEYAWRQHQQHQQHQQTHQEHMPDREHFPHGENFPDRGQVLELKHSLDLERYSNRQHFPYQEHFSNPQHIPDREYFSTRADLSNQGHYSTQQRFLEREHFSDTQSAARLLGVFSGLESTERETQVTSKVPQSIVRTANRTLRGSGVAKALNRRRKERRRRLKMSARHFEFAVRRQPQMFLKCLSSVPLQVTNDTAYGNALMANYLNDIVGGVAWLSPEVRSSGFCFPDSTSSHISRLTGLANKLMWLGSKHKDERLLRDAKRRHVAGCQALKEKVATPANLISIVDAASKLKCCLLYQNMSCNLSKHKLWARYINGMANVIDAHGNSIPISRDGSAQLHAFRHDILMFSLLERQPLFNENLWQACSRTSLPEPAERLTQLASRIPALLKRDIQSTETMSGPTPKLSRLLELESAFIEFKQEQTNFNGSIGNGHGTIAQQRLRRDRERRIWKNEPGADYEPRFNPLLNAHCEALCWTCLLLIRQELEVEAQRCPTYVIDRNLPAEVDHCTDQMCRIIQRESKTSRTWWSKVHIVRPLFHFITKRCERTEDIMKCYWCREQENRFRLEVPYIDWEIMLYASFSTMTWLA